MKYDTLNHLEIYEEQRLEAARQKNSDHLHKASCRNELCSSLEEMRTALEKYTQGLPPPYKSFVYGADGLERSNLLFCIADKSLAPNIKLQNAAQNMFFSLRDMILAFPHMHFKIYNVLDKTIQVTIDDKECRKIFRNIVCRDGNYMRCLDKLMEEYMHVAFPHGEA